MKITHHVFPTSHIQMSYINSPKPPNIQFFVIKQNNFQKFYLHSTFSTRQFRVRYMGHEHINRQTNDKCTKTLKMAKCAVRDFYE